MTTPLSQLPGYVYPGRLRTQQEPTPPRLDAPGPPLPGQATEHAKADAVETLLGIQDGSYTDRLLALYRRAASGQLPDKRGRRWISLTDDEAAKVLGCRRSTINASRAPLCKAGLVGRYRKRLCRVSTSGRQVVGWALVSAIERAS